MPNCSHNPLQVHCALGPVHTNPEAKMDKIFSVPLPPTQKRVYARYAHDRCDVIVFKKLPFSPVYSNPFSNILSTLESVLNSVFGLCFRPQLPPLHPM